MIPSKQDVAAALERVSPYVHKTPVLSSTLLNEISGASVFFKCDNLQRGGSFKIRGATNAILQLSEEQRTKGVVTHSSGNFAQALSLAARSLGVKAYIVMPDTAPEVKKAAVRDYGGEIVECETVLSVREATAARIQEEKGATFVHPSDDTQVILGQGTAAMELLEEQPDLDYVVTPVGGGGLVAGSALSAHYFGKDCKTIAGEPLEVDDAYRSMKSGKIESNITINTIADGLKTQLGEMNFPIIMKHVDQIIRVTEDEIISAMKLVYERMKIIIEPSSAVAFAAVLNKKDLFKGKKVGIVISGGNVDLSKLPF
ncbi:pyridoxal-phosphate dependent enzyme [Leptobacterium flavescens]|uniref:Pyridoxal-phosphate dependent enzyme n=1 Tax=Leptobacterium flavescens TaxID=472055 RepID=A0A6P0URB5_9FLAO|nr:threonine/serine dehydratase [Leptobacterium flavescens]NER13393.1 pyridoxal-phosphate dependent enzyme [Leptobacterium flavescens]